MEGDDSPCEQVPLDGAWRPIAISSVKVRECAHLGIGIGVVSVARVVESNKFYFLIVPTNENITRLEITMSYSILLQLIDCSEKHLQDISAISGKLFLILHNSGKRFTFWQELDRDCKIVFD